MSRDPFGDLGLGRDASAGEVRTARRRLAKELHPDVGGSALAMQRVNTAAAAALRQIQDRDAATPREQPGRPAPPEQTGQAERAGQTEWTEEWAGVGFDVPSFTVEALPVDTFHALLLATEGLGAVADEEPPYRLDVEMAGPPRTWCRLEIAPDAGASTVSLAVTAEGGRPVQVEQVRDQWVAALNDLDWSRLRG